MMLRRRLAIHGVTLVWRVWSIPQDSNRPSLGGWRARGQRLAAMAKTESDSDAPKGSLATPEARKMRLKEIAKKMEEDRATLPISKHVVQASIV